MALKQYLQMPAYVANGGSGGAALILSGADFQVYAKEDYARATPLPTYYLNGQVRPALVSNRDGVIPPFMLDEVEAAVWRNGELEGPLICLEGITGAPGSNILPLRESLIEELTGPGEVRDFMDAEYHTSGLSAQLSAVVGTAASVEELTISVVLDTWLNQRTPGSDRNLTLWIAPFPCRIMWVALSFDYMSKAASDTDYVTFRFDRLAGGAATTLVDKTTQATGGEAITARTAWDFTQNAWTTADFAAGNLLTMSLNVAGTATIELPMTATIRYRPL